MFVAVDTIAWFGFHFISNKIVFYIRKDIGKIMPITCDASTPHFSSGCELLLHYDKNYDGLINTAELTQSYTDYENGIITYEEFDFVSDAYINEGINVICPGCFLTCIQNFIVYDKVGNPVVGEWTVHVEITEEDTGVFIDEKTCTVGSDGKCSVELPEGTWITAYAKKNSEVTIGYSSAACFTNPVDLWQSVNCIDPTPNHTSGREMLLYWDKDKDGVMSKDEVTDAILDNLMGGAMTTNEVVLVIVCYENYAGIIDDMCPPTVTITFSANVAAALYVDGEHKGMLV